LSRPPSAKSDADSAPSDEALSRIAREAVHQPADPRLDRQLERLGVTDARPSIEPPGSKASSPAGASVAEVERLSARLRRVETTLFLLLAAVVIVALVEVILLLR
jgi:hypothetical protein